MKLGSVPVHRVRGTLLGPPRRKTQGGGRYGLEAAKLGPNPCGDRIAAAGRTEPGTDAVSLWDNQVFNR